MSMSVSFCLISSLCLMPFRFICLSFLYFYSHRIWYGRILLRKGAAQQELLKGFITEDMTRLATPAT